MFTETEINVGASLTCGVKLVFEADGRFLIFSFLFSLVLVKKIWGPEATKGGKMKKQNTL